MDTTDDDMRLDADDGAEVSDDELVGMYARGDTDAFDVIFDRYHVAVYNFAYHMLERASDAEEIMQEAFLAVARSAATYRPRGRFRSWLMSIARNLCLNRLQAERARRQALAEGGLVVLGRASAPSPEDHVQAGEERCAVMCALRSLPERQREAVILHAFQGMSYREIAATLEMPIGTVKTLLHRARAALADVRAGGRGRECSADGREGHRAV
jgi:RNA polymerase sigma-70 factor (ECF subfamily)